LIVTGGIACGKSTLLQAAEELGYKCLDVDDWFHEEMKGTALHHYTFKGWFGSSPVAFIHPNWKEYERWLMQHFDMYLTSNTPEVCVIPNLEGFDIKPSYKILTVERKANQEAAILRDTHRNVSLTQRIHNTQLAREQREEVADWVLINDTSSSQEFKQKCTEWFVEHRGDLL